MTLAYNIIRHSIEDVVIFQPTHIAPSCRAAVTCAVPFAHPDANDLLVSSGARRGAFKLADVYSIMASSATALFVGFKRCFVQDRMNIAGGDGDLEISVVLLENGEFTEACPELREKVQEEIWPQELHRSGLAKSKKRVIGDEAHAWALSVEHGSQGKSANFRSVTGLKDALKPSPTAGAVVEKRPVVVEAFGCGLEVFGMESGLAERAEASPKQGASSYQATASCKRWWADYDWELHQAALKAEREGKEFDEDAFETAFDRLAASGYDLSLPTAGSMIEMEMASMIASFGCDSVVSREGLEFKELSDASRAVAAVDEMRTASADACSGCKSMVFGAGSGLKKPLDAPSIVVTVVEMRTASAEACSGCESMFLGAGSGSQEPLDEPPAVIAVGETYVSADACSGCKSVVCSAGSGLREPLDEPLAVAAVGEMRNASAEPRSGCESVVLGAGSGLQKRLYAYPGVAGTMRNASAVACSESESAGNGMGSGVEEPQNASSHVEAVIELQRASIKALFAAKLVVPHKTSKLEAFKNVSTAKAVVMMEPVSVKSNFAAESVGLGKALNLGKPLAASSIANAVVTVDRFSIESCNAAVSDVFGKDAELGESLNASPTVSTLIEMQATSVESTVSVSEAVDFGADLELGKPVGVVTWAASVDRKVLASVAIDFGAPKGLEEPKIASSVGAVVEMFVASGKPMHAPALTSRAVDFGAPTGPDEQMVASRLVGNVAESVATEASRDLRKCKDLEFLSLELDFKKGVLRVLKAADAKGDLSPWDRNHWRLKCLEREVALLAVYHECVLKKAELEVLTAADAMGDLPPWDWYRWRLTCLKREVMLLTLQLQAEPRLLDASQPILALKESVVLTASKAAATAAVVEDAAETKAKTSAYATHKNDIYLTDTHCAKKVNEAKRCSVWIVIAIVMGIVGWGWLFGSMRKAKLTQQSAFLMQHLTETSSHFDRDDSKALSVWKPWTACDRHKPMPFDGSYGDSLIDIIYSATNCDFGGGNACRSLPYENETVIALEDTSGQEIDGDRAWMAVTFNFIENTGIRLVTVDIHCTVKGVASMGAADVSINEYPIIFTSYLLSLENVTLSQGIHYTGQPTITVGFGEGRFSLTAVCESDDTSGDESVALSLWNSNASSNDGCFSKGACLRNFAGNASIDGCFWDGACPDGFVESASIDGSISDGACADSIPGSASNGGYSSDGACSDVFAGNASIDGCFLNGARMDGFADSVIAAGESKVTAFPVAAYLEKVSLDGASYGKVYADFVDRFRYGARWDDDTTVAAAALSNISIYTALQQEAAIEWSSSIRSTGGNSTGGAITIGDGSADAYFFGNLQHGARWDVGTIAASNVSTLSALEQEAASEWCSVIKSDGTRNISLDAVDFEVFFDYKKIVSTGEVIVDIDCNFGPGVTEFNSVSFKSNSVSLADVMLGDTYEAEQVLFTVAFDSGLSSVTVVCSRRPGAASDLASKWENGTLAGMIIDVDPFASLFDPSTALHDCRGACEVSGQEVDRVTASLFRHVLTVLVAVTVYVVGKRGRRRRQLLWQRRLDYARQVAVVEVIPDDCQAAVVEDIPDDSRAAVVEDVLMRPLPAKVKGILRKPGIKYGPHGRRVKFTEKVAVRAFDITVGLRQVEALSTDYRGIHFVARSKHPFYPLGLDWTFVDEQVDMGAFGQKCTRYDQRGFRLHCPADRLRRLVGSGGFTLEELKRMDADARVMHYDQMDALVLALSIGND
ncbi:hypothetical protein MPSEU_000880500 [Mayamaea pseudoterrestris]|nr:hypothetical protein MPSEU_000880500 [Mayamaea pseudoterrestris]